MSVLAVLTPSMTGIEQHILDALLLKINTSYLTHEVLTTLMAEVTIINSKPLVPISTDPEAPTVFTLSVLLTEKINTLSVPAGDVDVNDVFNKHWKRVQDLAAAFWRR